MGWSLLIGKGWAWGPRPERWYKKQIEELRWLKEDFERQVKDLNESITWHRQQGTRGHDEIVKRDNIRRGALSNKIIKINGQIAELEQKMLQLKK